VKRRGIHQSSKKFRLGERDGFSGLLRNPGTGFAFRLGR
jgi:hypothetical protein